MWKLNKVGNSILEQYVQEMMTSLKNRITKILSSTEVQVLIPGFGTPAEDMSVLKGLLIEEPQQLIDRNNAIMSSLISGYCESELPAFQKAKLKRKRNAKDLLLLSKYDTILKKLLKVFDYEGQLSKCPERAYYLTALKGVNVCTYCNCQYIFTINKPKGKELEHIVRPELDHWFNKELYPLLSLSFYNLIPSCHFCNSSVKRNDLFSLVTHVHPYLQQDANPTIQFRPTIVSGRHISYSVVIDRAVPSKEDNTVKAFALDERYAVHGRLEVDDLMRFNNSYSNSYLQTLFDQILNNFCSKMTKAEVYRMLFGTELEPERFCNRPLSKLKYDILKYLKVI
jgi:hypothetical protein